MLGLVTDSSACLAGAGTGTRLAVVPLTVTIDGEEVPADSERRTELIDAALRDGTSRVSTASPRIERYVAAFEALAAQGVDEVICAPIGEKLSGSARAARAAAGLTDLAVSVMSTDQAGPALGVPLRDLAALLETGTDLSAGAATDLLSARIGGSRTLLAVSDLGHLRRGGRLTPTQSSLATVLGRRPLVAIVDGELRQLGTIAAGRRRVATFAAALGRLAGHDTTWDLAIACDRESRPQAEHLAQDLPQVLDGVGVGHDRVSIRLLDVGLLAHTGPRAIGISLVPAR